jgi:hypothetical protein
MIPPQKKTRRAPSVQFRRNLTDAVLYAALLLATLLLPACSQYSLRGHVIEGNSPGLIIIDADDERLTLPGLSDASIEITLDPNSLGKKQIANSRSLPTGSFDIPIDEFGAGVLRYELGALVRLHGYRATHQLFWMPPTDKRLLITLKPGTDLYVPPENPLHEAEQFLENLP